MNMEFKDTDFNKIDTSNEDCNKDTYFPISVFIHGTPKRLSFKAYMTIRKHLEISYEEEQDFEHIKDKYKISYTGIFIIEPSLYKYQ